MVAIVIALVALAAGVAALVIALKKQTVIKEVTEKQVVKTEEVTTVVHAPVEHPFVYDEENKVYWLNGSLKVSGGVSCLNNEKEE